MATRRCSSDAARSLAAISASSGRLSTCTWTRRVSEGGRGQCKVGGARWRGWGACCLLYTSPSPRDGLLS
eukprot:1998078-Pleurochrysis_carterae.AAC.1